jgi:disulfide oxidoreductase YuzD
MKTPITVQMIGAPVACAEGIKETWREVAEWAQAQLTARFGEQISFTYYDLFDSACPPMLGDTQLPYILVAGEAVINGGKVSVPLLRRKIEALLGD